MPENETKNAVMKRVLKSKGNSRNSAIQALDNAH